MKILYKYLCWTILLGQLLACSGTSYVSGSFVSDQVGTATLTWDAPIKNTDGSTLTDLSGYVIYYGKKPSLMNKVIIIDDPEADEVVVEGLGSNVTYYFVMTAKNSMDVESELSDFAK